MEACWTDAQVSHMCRQVLYFSCFCVLITKDPKPTGSANTPTYITRDVNNSFLVAETEIFVLC